MSKAPSVINGNVRSEFSTTIHWDLRPVGIITNNDRNYAHVRSHKRDCRECKHGSSDKRIIKDQALLWLGVDTSG